MATLKAPFALDRSLNTTEVTPRNIADVLAEGLSHITGRTASEVEYDNSESELTADNVQDAIDEVNGKVPTLPSVDIQTAVDEFETYNGGLLSECKVALSPIQDLHGYDSPWVGGSSKNKLNSTLVTASTKNGITCTPQFDDGGNLIGYQLSGTATANADFQLHNAYGSTDVYIPSGTYKANNTGAINGIELHNGYGNDSYPVAYGNTDTEITCLSGISWTILRVANGTAINTPILVQPMIRLATESNPTFASYSNICPISGHTQVEVGNEGKNKLPNEATSQTVNGVTFDINNDGGITLDGQSTADWTGITLTSAKLLKAGTYTVSCPRVNSVDTRLIISYDGAEKVNTYNVDYKTFTLTEDKIISVRFVIRNSGVSFSNVTYYPMIELGSTATPYVPYNGYQVTVNLGGTYYSGTLDVVSGVLTVDTVAKTYNGTENWVASNNGYYLNVPLSDAKASALAISNLYKYNATTWTSGCFGITASKTLWVGNTNLLSVISANNLFVVYELATPTPIQLSPTMVKALVGENHLDAPLEGQEITESKYRELFTWDEVESYVNAHIGGGSGMNYSTNEQVIGTWIDGKPLYQRTYDLGSEITISGSSWQALGINTSGFKIILKCSGIASDGTFQSELLAWNNSGTLYVQTPRNSTGYVLYITLQYTKTTD